MGVSMSIAATHVSRYLAALILLAGCVPTLSHEPESGPRARVRFSTDSPGVTFIYQYRDVDCKQDELELGRLRNGICLLCSGKRLGMPLWNYHNNAAKEIYVTAGTMFYGLMQDRQPPPPIAPDQLPGLVAGMSTTGKTARFIPLAPSRMSGAGMCGVPVSFVFEENVDYDVDLKWEQCTVEIFRLQRDETANIVRVPQETTSVLNQGCFDALLKTRLY